MLMKLIPPQYRLAAAGIAAVALLTGAFGAGWTVNGWRLADKIERLDGDLRTCEGNTADLRGAVDRQNTRLAQAKLRADQAQKAAREALEVARKESSSLEAEIAALRGARGKTCKDAENLINEALGL